MTDENWWRCAVVACAAPVGTPHVPTCPYDETGGVLTLDDCLRLSPDSSEA